MWNQAASVHGLYRKGGWGLRNLKVREKVGYVGRGQSGCKKPNFKVNKPESAQILS